MSWVLTTFGSKAHFPEWKGKDIPWRKWTFLFPCGDGQSWWALTEVKTYSFLSWPEGIWEPGFQLGETGPRATCQREETWPLPYYDWLRVRQREAARLRGWTFWYRPPLVRIISGLLCCIFLLLSLKLQQNLIRSCSLVSPVWCEIKKRGWAHT